MKVEVRSQDPATKAALSVKVQSYEKALASVKGDLMRAKEKEDKDALLGGVRACVGVRSGWGGGSMPGWCVCMCGRCGGLTHDLPHVLTPTICRASRRSTGSGCSTPTTSWRSRTGPSRTHAR